MDPESYRLLQVRLAADLSPEQKAILRRIVEEEYR
jgi:hypothetical protein